MAMAKTEATTLTTFLKYLTDRNQAMTMSITLYDDQDQDHGHGHVVSHGQYQDHAHVG